MNHYRIEAGCQYGEFHRREKRFLIFFPTGVPGASERALPVIASVTGDTRAGPDSRSWPT